MKQKTKKIKINNHKKKTFFFISFSSSSTYQHHHHFCCCHPSLSWLVRRVPISVRPRVSRLRNVNKINNFRFFVATARVCVCTLVSPQPSTQLFRNCVAWRQRPRDQKKLKIREEEEKKRKQRHIYRKCRGDRDTKRLIA